MPPNSKLENLRRTVSWLIGFRAPHNRPCVSRSSRLALKTTCFCAALAGCSVAPSPVVHTLAPRDVDEGGDPEQIVNTSPSCEFMAGVWTSLSRRVNLESRYSDGFGEEPFDHLVLGCHYVRIPLVAAPERCPSPASHGIVWGSDCTVYCESGLAYSISNNVVEIKPYKPWVADRIIVRSADEVLLISDGEQFVYYRCDLASSSCRDIARRSSEALIQCY